MHRHIPLFWLGILPLGLRMPAASQRCSAQVAVVVAFGKRRGPEASPELLFIPVQGHRCTDGRNDMARIRSQRVLMVVGILMSRSSFGGRVLLPWPAVSPLPVIGWKTGPCLLHHTPTAAPRAGGPGPPTSPHAWDS